MKSIFVVENQLIIKNYKKHGISRKTISRFRRKRNERIG